MKGVEGRSFRSVKVDLPKGQLVPAVRSRQPSLWMLVLITFSGTLAMHMFVPALPIAAHDLGASVPAVQATISLYIVAPALEQLVYGPL